MAKPSRWLLSLAIATNLIVLGTYKYAVFASDVLSELLGIALTIPNLELPLGISFFTFTQIAFLVDASRGIAEDKNAPRYALFVTYFPHLLAGPILHHREMMKQFMAPNSFLLGYSNLSQGLSIFVIGLAKKVLLADGIATYVPDAFSPGGAQDAFSCWIGVLAYTLQIYFDFSGYSDMAIGMSRMIGIELPVNFNSPYKATSIIEFWRRWHMTLSSFLRDYLYFSLGGSRNGPQRRYMNLMITMLLGGLWHGAGWTYIIWGGLHGSLLAANHLLRSYCPGLTGTAWRFIGHTATFLSVCVLWVFFRASDLDQALYILKGLAGLRGLGSYDLAWLLPRVVFIAALLSISLFAPNCQELMARKSGFHWHPSLLWAGALSLALALCLITIGRPSEFLYFQF